jgi:transcriptional regulator with XRE-family HTH domain
MKRDVDPNRLLDYARDLLDQHNGHWARIAAEMGVSRQWIKRFRTGDDRANPSYKFLVELIDFLERGSLLPPRRYIEARPRPSEQISEAQS